VAADRGRGFGLASAQVKVRKDLQILSSLPAFLIPGDQFEARFIVQNLSARPGVAQVRLQAPDQDMAEQNPLTMELQPGQMRAAAFAVRVPLTRGEGTVSLNVSASLNDLSDSARFTLPLLPPAPLSYAAAAGLAQPGKPGWFELDPPAGALQTEITLCAAPSPVSSLAGIVDSLRRYPYLCLEQRVSKALGLAFRLRYPQFSGSKADAAAEEKMRAQIEATLASFAEFQGPNGQMHFWNNFSHYDYFLYPYLTAYVLAASQAIKEMSGLSMDAEVEKRAFAFLQKTLNLVEPGTIEQGTEAMIIALLAERNADNYWEASAAGLLASLSEQDPFALSWLLLAAKSMNSRQLMDDLVVRLNKGAVQESVYMHFNAVSQQQALGSPVRDNAAALLALNSAAPHFPALEKLAHWLSVRAAQAGLNTQEAAYMLLAMHAYLQRLEPRPELGFRLQLPGQHGETAEKVIRLSLQDSPNYLSTLQGAEARPGRYAFVSADGPLYWSGRLSYLPPAPSQAINAGFGLSRELLVAGERGLLQAQVGQVVECRLLLTVPETRLHVLLFDPLPAGLEALDAASLGGEGAQEESGPWQWREMRRDGLVLYAPKLEPGVYSFNYKLRAMAPGRFVHRNPLVEEMYAPENHGRGEGGIFKIN
jgi:uncharacterized protein YfaS (alpha-2-macroglobulin family)